MKVFIVLTAIFLGAIIVTLQVNSENATNIPSSEPNPQEKMILPDLIITVPDELFIQTEDGRRKIRFNTTFINEGEAAFEVHGEHNYENEVTRATQVIQTRDGATIEHEIGEFVLHPDHEHWHIGEYVVFQLWSTTEKGSLDEMLASTDKMSFCIWDRDQHDLSLESAPVERVYETCSDETQGLSVGWSDTYRANIEGQELDITDISDGQYIVRSIINPDQKIIESNYENNIVSVPIEIAGDDLTVLSEE